jgi:hypothetical protein
MPRTSARATSQAEFRFYEELNDFLAPVLRKRAFSYAFNGTPSVKDAIEAIGVPHTEVDLVLVDGKSVDFTRRLAGGERVAVYPVFERLDISQVTRLRARPLRVTRFVLDVHLGKLARYLRLLGFDTCYRNDYDDDAIIGLARGESRIILTRDKGAAAATCRNRSGVRSDRQRTPVFALHPLQRRTATGSEVFGRGPVATARARAFRGICAMPPMCGRVLARLPLRQDAQDDRRAVCRIVTRQGIATQTLQMNRPGVPSRNCDRYSVARFSCANVRSCNV